MFACSPLGEKTVQWTVLREARRVRYARGVSRDDGNEVGVMVWGQLESFLSLEIRYLYLIFLKKTVFCDIILYTKSIKKE